MADKLESRVLRVISDFPSKTTPGSGKKLHVIQYAKDEGRPGSKSWKTIAVKLEGGEYWKDEESGQTRFKPKGLTKWDLEALLKPGEGGLRVIQNVLQLMKEPPAFVPPNPPPAADAPGDAQDDDAPFS